MEHISVTVKNEFSKEGKTWIVNKENHQGAKWCYELGWHFDEDAPGCTMFLISELADRCFDGSWQWKPNVREIIKEKACAGFVGEIGQTIEKKVVYLGAKRSGAYSLLHFFETENGEKIICKTKKSFDIGEELFVKGRVSDCVEYGNKKQTVLSGCSFRA